MSHLSLGTHLFPFTVASANEALRIRKLLELVPSTMVWSLMDRQPLETWVHSDGKVCLLGDACHPMLVSPALPYAFPPCLTTTCSHTVRKAPQWPWKMQQSSETFSAESLPTLNSPPSSKPTKPFATPELAPSKLPLVRTNTSSICPMVRHSRQGTRRCGWRWRLR